MRSSRMVLQKNKKYNLVYALSDWDDIYFQEGSIKRCLPFFVHLRESLSSVKWNLTNFLTNMLICSVTINCRRTKIYIAVYSYSYFILKQPRSINWNDYILINKMSWKKYLYSLRCVEFVKIKNSLIKISEFFYQTKSSIQTKKINNCINYNIEHISISFSSHVIIKYEINYNGWTQYAHWIKLSSNSDNFCNSCKIKLVAKEKSSLT